MYAITLDIDPAGLQQTYGSPSWQEACTDIKQFLEIEGFSCQLISWPQGAIYFGDIENSLTCVRATAKMATLWPWFKTSIRDIQIIRISNPGNLPAIQA